MVSQIDPTIPVYGTPTTESVRANFATAQQEITDLQVSLVGSPFLPISGGQLTGPLLLVSDPVTTGSPTDNSQAATKRYVDQSVAQEVLWRGVYHVAQNNPALDQLVFGQTLFNGYSWTAVTAVSSTPEALTVALPPLAIGTLIYNGSTLRYSTEQGWTVIPGSALDLNTAESIFVQLTGGAGAMMTGPITLPTDPSQPLQAATKNYVDSQFNSISAQALGAVQRAGDTMTGLLVLSGPPTQPLNAATKAYVDAGVAAALPLAGGQLTGPLLLASDPTAPPQAATKNYIDTKIWTYAALPPEIQQIPIAFPIGGKPGAGQLIHLPIGMSLQIANALFGTQAFQNTVCTSASTFTLNRIRSGTTMAVGTITFGTTGTTAFTLAGTGAALLSGDILQLVAPSPQDATLADIGITIMATRQ